MDLKKLAPIISALGVLVMIVWGALANDWEHSWVAACVGGVISGLIYSYSKPKDNK